MNITKWLALCLAIVGNAASAQHTVDVNGNLTGHWEIGISPYQGWPKTWYDTVEIGDDSPDALHAFYASRGNTVVVEKWDTAVVTNHTSFEAQVILETNVTLTNNGLSAQVPFIVTRYIRSIEFQTVLTVIHKGETNKILLDRQHIGDDVQYTTNRAVIVPSPLYQLPEVPYVVLTNAIVRTNTIFDQFHTNL